MFKKIFIGAFAALAFSVIYPTGVMAAETNDNVNIDGSGKVTLMSDHAASDEITTLQLSLKVETSEDADISFEFSSDSDIKVSEYRFDQDSNQLNIYLSDSQPLFDNGELLKIGAVSAKNTDGNNVSVTVKESENSLKYVYNNTLVNVDAAFNIEAPPLVTEPTEPTEPTATIAETAAPTKSTTEAAPETAAPAASAATEAKKDHIASDEELSDWSKKDYKNKNGVMPDNAEINETADGKYKITLTDGSQNVLDVYVIDPETGIGTDSAGKEVNLPQTGNNSPRNILIAVGACVLMLFGFCVLKFSGINRRKKNER